MFKQILKTENDYVALVLRVLLAIVFFPHGAQKMLGWFGGGGFQGTMQGMSQNMGIPSFFVFLVIVAEFFGPIGLLIGLLGRIAAFGIGCVMVVAVFMVHVHNGFFMNWYGTASGEGFEYHILALAIVLAVMIRGSGAMSIDRAISK
jgi:putative oxidoreductase